MEQRPNGRWLARIQRGERADGRPRAVSKTFDTRAEAEAWLLAQSVALGSRPDLSGGVTLRALWAMYAQARLPQLARKTQAQYRWYMEGTTSADGRAGGRTSWLDVLGEADVSLVDVRMAQAHIDTLSHMEGTHAKCALSSVLSWGVSAGIVATNPLVGHRFRYAPLPEPDYDSDPFAAIEGARQVWGAAQVLECFERIRGLPLEACWLACAGAGLRVEEALALRGKDVRRQAVGGRDVTQLAVHAARTDMDERKATKTRQSVRIVAVMEPLGERYWEIASEVGRDELVCPISAGKQNRRWRGYFAEPSRSKHAPRKEGCNYLGRLHGLPYVPLSKMRNTHVTLMQQAGVADTLNALMHGHSEQTERRHYMRPDHVAVASGAALRLVS